MKITIIFGLLLSFSVYANNSCSGWHEFRIVEEENMQFLDSYLYQFQPELECSKPLKGKDVLKAAEKIIAAYKKCTQCDEPDVDYKTKFATGSYQFCTSNGAYEVGPWSWDSITTIKPYKNTAGNNLSFIKTAHE